MSQIGNPVREIEFIPVPNEVPDDLPVAPEPEHIPEREPVPV